MKKAALLIFGIVCFGVVSAQECDCKTNFEWMKTTFENNDAGFSYAIENKGQQAYDDHNKRILEKVKSTSITSDCVTILNEWLKFFRSGHLGIDYTYPQGENVAPTVSAASFTNWEKLKVDMKKFEKELNSKKEPDY